jgi:lipopolysaccharide export system permease protein
MEYSSMLSDTSNQTIEPLDTNKSELLIKRKNTERTISRFQQYKVKPGLPKDIMLEKMKRKKEISATINKTSPTNAVVTEDSLIQKDSIIAKPTFEENMTVIDSIMNTEEMDKIAYNRALTHVRYVKNNMMMRNSQLENLKTEINKYQLERYKKLSYAITILIMFFIGAPLGAIIKRGGLGVPVLISLSFFILFYVISMICEKWTRTDVMDPLLAAWMANIILLPCGIFFLKQAKNDARLFETDFYSVLFRKLKDYLMSMRSLMPFR